MSIKHNSRGAAALMIGRWLGAGEFPGRQLNEAQLDDRPFITELVLGVVRWQRMLEWAIGRCARKMPKRGLKAFLLVGAYEVLLMRSACHHASVNELVEAVKIGCSPGEMRFANAVMRRLVSEKSAILADMPNQLAGIRLSHPDILIDRWRALFGEDAALRVCEWNNNGAGITLKVNTLVSSIPACLSVLRSAGVAIEDESNAENGWIVLARGAGVRGMPGYGEGHFAVMDRAAGMAVELLDPQPGESVLDACAAPGGKTFLIAERMRRKGRLAAMDLHADRMGRLRDNLHRLRCDGFVEVVQGDTGRMDKAETGAFDRVLLDVPCSNTGVIRRKPDVRWRFSEARLKSLVRTQRDILNSCLDGLRSGARAVYSTCSLESDENEEVVRSCLAARSGMRLVEERRLTPPGSNCDGAYAALLEKDRS